MKHGKQLYFFYQEEPINITIELNIIQEILSRFLIKILNVNIKTIFNSQQKTYALYGALFGCIFPIVGTLIEAWSRYHKLDLVHIGLAQRSSLLVWIIDTAPLFLGVFASYGGLQLDRVSVKNAELDDKYKQMVALKEISDKASIAKSDFLANMSHEIRTPMNAILGMNYLLKKSRVDAKQADYLRKIEVSARNLLRIIDDILDFSKIEAGKLSLETTDLFLEELIADLSDTVNVKLQTKNDVELITILDPAIPPVIMGDSVRLRQVLLNLTDNAVKFTESGEIKLEAKLVQKLPYGIIIHFSVTDSGIGISEEQIRRIFNPFQQADLSTTRKFGGTGLGLAICKKIVEMMDGELEVTSVTGQGSVFSFNAFFSIPFQNTAIVGATKTTKDLLGMKALLVDDSDSARMVLSDMLSSFGFEVLVASNALEAIQIFVNELDSGTPLSLLVVDWRMPGMDGLQLVRKLRETNGNEVPSVLMVTAFGLEKVVEATKQNLVDGYLLKPINPSVLYDTINNILDLGKKKANSHKFDFNKVDEFRAKLSGNRVLLVEDNEINLELAGELLNDVNIEFEVARNGLEAIEMVQKWDYDAVLMDIQMPEMDGLTATKKIRLFKSKDHLPIIAMTAHAMKGEYEKSIASGMNDHITKPIDPMVLYERLAYYIKTSPKPQIIKAEEPSTLNNDTIIPEIEGIDIVAGLARTGGKKDIYLKLLGKFAANYKGFRSTFMEQYQNEDMDAAAALLHTLAGVAGNIGIESLFVDARELSRILKDLPTPNLLENTLTDRINTLITSLESMTENIELALGLTEKTPINKAEHQNEFEFQNSLTKLYQLLNDADSEAGECCEELLLHAQVSGPLKERLLEANKYIENFDFDNAIKALKQD